MAIHVAVLINDKQWLIWTQHTACFELCLESIIRGLEVTLYFGEWGSLILFFLFIIIYNYCVVSIPYFLHHLFMFSIYIPISMQTFPNCLPSPKEAWESFSPIFFYTICLYFFLIVLLTLKHTVFSCKWILSSLR